MKDTLSFNNRQALRDWFSNNLKREDGFWLEFTKNGEKDCLKAEEALEEALCFGWIDGQIKKVDESLYLKYFAPRRKGSNWSEKNKKLADQLITLGLMTENGLFAIQQAKESGQWDAPAPSGLGDEDFSRFIQAISSSEKASSNFSRMPRSVQKQFVGLYHDAKKEDTRIKRLQKLVGLLEENKKPMGG